MPGWLACLPDAPDAAQSEVHVDSGEHVRRLADDAREATRRNDGQSMPSTPSSAASCAFMRATSPSAWAATPNTRPDCSACSVVSPMGAGGTSMGMLASLAAFSNSAEADSMSPGAMQPPR